MRILIHPQQESILFEKVTEILDAAIIAEPDTFEHVTGKPAIVDHYGYHTDVVSSVILSQEYGSAYFRLTIKHGEHPVYDALQKVVEDYYAAVGILSR